MKAEDLISSALAEADKEHKKKIKEMASDLQKFDLVRTKKLTDDIGEFVNKQTPKYTRGEVSLALASLLVDISSKYPDPLLMIEGCSYLMKQHRIKYDKEYVNE